jgi:hypothetical protein
MVDRRIEHLFGAWNLAFPCPIRVHLRSSCMLFLSSLFGVSQTGR